MIANNAWNLRAVTPSPQFRSPKASRSRLITQLDFYTYAHSMRVKKIALEIGEILGLPRNELANLGNAALFHDIGKIKIPLRILNKKTSLSLYERHCIRGHARHGAEMWLETGGYYGVSEAILCHHECYNGSGYPLGLHSLDIPHWSRIISIADALDAMVSRRSYSKPMTLDQALSRIKCAGGVQFDPFLVEMILFNQTSKGTECFKTRLENRVYQSI